MMMNKTVATKSKNKLAEAFHEVYSKKPKTVPSSKHGVALRRQLIAIALSKARAKGAKV
jgi:hypothetical protein